MNTSLKGDREVFPETMSSRSGTSQFNPASKRVVLRMELSERWLELQKTKTDHVRRVCKYGGIPMNNGDIYHVDELFPYKHMWDRVQCCPFALCRDRSAFTRESYKKNQLTNQAPDKITHFICGKGHRVDCKISIIVVQIQVVPYDCKAC